jgi:hypothetical protein
MKVLPAPARWATVPPTIEATLTIAAPEIGAALVSRALRSLERGEVTPDVRVLGAIASQIADHSPVGMDEVTARYLEPLTRTDTHPAGRSPQNK